MTSPKVLLCLVSALLLLLVVESRRTDFGTPEDQLNQVKLYLQTYGYLYDLNEESLESAIKRYQKNYGLKVTGQADAETVTKMKAPRCGNSDIVAGRVIDDMPRYWSKMQLTYSFAGGAQVVVPVDQLRQIFARAFSKWAPYCGLTFQEVIQVGAESDITIGFFSGDHGDGRPFDVYGKVLAHAIFRPEVGSLGMLLHFNAAVNWSIRQQPGAGEVDLESVAVHEIGELLGLGHNMNPDSIMYAQISPGVTKRDLAQEDIDAIRALYPNRDFHRICAILAGNLVKLEFEFQEVVGLLLRCVKCSNPAWNPIASFAPIYAECVALCNFRLFL